MKLRKAFLVTAVSSSLLLAACGKKDEVDLWQETGDGDMGNVEVNTTSDDDDYNNVYFIDDFVKLEKEDARIPRNHSAIQLIWNKYADGENQINNVTEKKDLNVINYECGNENFNITTTEENGNLKKGTINLTKNMSRENKYKYLAVSLTAITKNISKYNINRVVEEIYNQADSKQNKYSFDEVSISISKKFSDNTEYIQITWNPI